MGAAELFLVMSIASFAISVYLLGYTRKYRLAVDVLSEQVAKCSHEVDVISGVIYHTSMPVED